MEMINENVMDALQCKIDHVEKPGPTDCKNCKYLDRSDGFESCDDYRIAKEVLAMLKEQEAVKPTWGRGKPFCGACGLRIHGGKFCSECGKPILWEGR